MVNNNPTTLTPTQHSILTGHLLGDGCLGIRQNCISPRLTIRRQLQDIEYNRWTHSHFQEMCSPNAVTIGSTYDERYDKTYEWCNLESRYIPAFKEYHSKWYPVKKKIIPTDLVLDALSIAVWFADDGFVGIKPKSNRLRVVFHAQGFTTEEVYFLTELLNNRYNVHFTVQKAIKGSNIIVGANEQSIALFKDIDSVFPESMTRKSSVWRTNDSFLGKLPPTKGNARSSAQMKLNIIQEMLSEKTFSLYSICNKFGLFSLNANHYNAYMPHMPAKRYMVKLLENQILECKENKIFLKNEVSLKNRVALELEKETLLKTRKFDLGL